MFPIPAPLCFCVYTAYQRTPHVCMFVFSDQGYTQLVILNGCRVCPIPDPLALSLILSTPLYSSSFRSLTDPSLIHLPYPWSSLLLSIILLLSGHWRTLALSLLLSYSSSFRSLTDPCPIPSPLLILLLSGHWRTLALSLLLPYFSSFRSLTDPCPIPSPLLVLLLSGHWRTLALSLLLLFFFFQVIDGPLPYPFSSLNSSFFRSLTLPYPWSSLLLS